MSRGQIRGIVEAFADLRTVLMGAEPEDKAEVYKQLGLRLTYEPGIQTVRRPTCPQPRWGKGLCPRGDLNPHAR